MHELYHSPSITTLGFYLFLVGWDIFIPQFLDEIATWSFCRFCCEYQKQRNCKTLFAEKNSIKIQPQAVLVYLLRF